MMRMVTFQNRLLQLLVLGLLLVAMPAPAQAEKQIVLASQSVTTAGGAVNATIGHEGRSAGYLVVATSAEVNSASLVVTANLADGIGGVALVCTTAAITTNATTLMLIDSAATAGAGVATVCPFSLAGTTVFTFTVTGATAGFTVAAHMLWQP